MHPPANSPILYLTLSDQQLESYSETILRRISAVITARVAWQIDIFFVIISKSNTSETDYHLFGLGKWTRWENSVFKHGPLSYVRVLLQVKTGCCGLDPTTGRGKQIHLAQMLLLPFVPIMALIIQNGLNMVNVLQYQYEMQETIDQVRKKGRLIDG